MFIFDPEKRFVGLPRKRKSPLNIPFRLPAPNQPLMIDPNNPFTKGLKSAWIFDAYRCEEIKHHLSPLIEETARTADGVASTGTETLKFHCDADMFKPFYGLCCFDFKANGNTPHVDGRLISTGDGNDAFQLFRGSSNGELGLLMGGTITYHPLTGADLWDGQRWTITVAWGTADRNIIAYDEAGTKYSDYDGTAWTVTDVPDSLFFLNQESGLRHSEGSMRFCYVWEGYMFDQELAIGPAMRNNPYQIFAPKRIPIPANERDIVGGFFLPNPKYHRRSMMIPGRLPAGNNFEVNKDHPMSQHLLSAFVFEGYRAYEAVQGQEFDESATSFQTTKGVYGISQTGTETMEYPLAHSNERGMLNDMGTMILSFTGVGTPATLARIVTTGNSGWDCYRNSNDTQLTWNLGGVSVNLTGLHDLWNGEEHIIAFSWRDQANWRSIDTIDKNGNALNANDSTTWAVGSSLSSLLFLNSASGDRQAEGTIKWCYVWGKLVPDVQHFAKQLLRNPYQMFNPNLGPRPQTRL